ncbi:hypothetical protein M422DRAFT_23989 [Sphaerobolus stellatus SS14]|nr:hypothetical protein M422DRAFT_23989 [Sphaerobolus stellatus SS14]
MAARDYYNPQQQEHQQYGQPQYYPPQGGPPQGQGGYYPAAPQQAYQQPGQYYSPQPQPQTVYV